MMIMTAMLLVWDQVDYKSINNIVTFFLVYCPNIDLNIDSDGKDEQFITLPKKLGNWLCLKLPWMIQEGCYGDTYELYMPIFIINNNFTDCINLIWICFKNIFIYELDHTWKSIISSNNSIGDKWKLKKNV